MGKSRKKICAGPCCCCKSQKRGKQFASRRFRRAEHRLVACMKYDSLPLRSMELTSPWDLGGDGKYVYTWDKNDERYVIWTRK